MKDVRGLRSTNLVLQDSHGNVKYSLENKVNIVITKYAPGGYLKLSERTLSKVYDCLTTPEINTILKAHCN